MGARPKISLRPLSQAEQQAFQPVAKASSERVDTVKRAKALLAVAAGKTFTQAGRLAGLSREGVSQLVERFNQRGLAGLVIAPGRGRKRRYGTQERARVVQEVRRQPDRVGDQSATWSLKLLQRALRRANLPAIGSTTIGRILHIDHLVSSGNRGGSSQRRHVSDQCRLASLAQRATARSS